MSTQTEPKLVTQIDFARAGQITPQMKEVAEREHRDPEYIRERVADGRIAIPANIVHIKKGMRAFGVGEGLSTKVNVNLGISGDKADAAEEWKKVKIAEDFGADAIMDLSNSGKTRQFRQQLIDETPLMVGEGDAQKAGLEDRDARRQPQLEAGAEHVAGIGEALANAA